MNFSKEEHLTQEIRKIIQGIKQKIRKDTLFYYSNNDNTRISNIIYITKYVEVEYHYENRKISLIDNTKKHIANTFIKYYLDKFDNLICDYYDNEILVKTHIINNGYHNVSFYYFVDEPSLFHLSKCMILIF